MEKLRGNRKRTGRLYYLMTACFLCAFLIVPGLFCACGGEQAGADGGTGSGAAESGDILSDAAGDEGTKGSAAGNTSEQARTENIKDGSDGREEIKEKKKKASQIFFDNAVKRAQETHGGEGTLLCSDTYFLCGIPVISFYPDTGHTWFTAEIKKRVLSLESQIATALQKAGFTEDGEIPEMICDGSEGIIIDYEYYWKGIYLSWTPKTELSKIELQGVPKALKPSVYSSVTQSVVTAENMFFEPFFVVLKHDFTDAEGITLPDEKYNTEDYGNFSLSEEGVTFRINDACTASADGSCDLPDGNPYTYTMTFDEIEPYLIYGFDGASNEDYIRKDLDPNERMVALTFDDGPGSGTKRIANIIAAYGGRCTFFGVGDHMEDDYYAERVQYVLDKGHEYGTHGYSHKIMTTLSRGEYWEDIYKAVKANVKATGKCPTLMRLPGGNINDYIRETSPFTLVYWGMGTADWSYRNMFETQEEVTGAIWQVVDDFLPSSGKASLLMHDLYSETACAVEYMVPILASRGYTFVTVSELLYYKGLEKAPGQYYNSVQMR